MTAQEEALILNKKTKKRATLILIVTGVLLIALVVWYFYSANQNEKLWNRTSSVLEGNVYGNISKPTAASDLTAAKNAISANITSWKNDVIAKFGGNTLVNKINMQAYTILDNARSGSYAGDKITLPLCSQGWSCGYNAGSLVTARFKPKLSGNPNVAPKNDLNSTIRWTLLEAGTSVNSYPRLLVRTV